MNDLLSALTQLATTIVQLVEIAVRIGFAIALVWVIVKIFNRTLED